MSAQHKMYDSGRCRKTKLGTDFDGSLWLQYDLFHKNKLPGSKKVNLVKFMLRVWALSEGDLIICLQKGY